MSDSLQPRGLQPTRLLCPWGSPDNNTGVGCHFLPQGIFLTQGLNTGLLHCRQILYLLSHQNITKELSIIHFCLDISEVGMNFSVCIYIKSLSHYIFNCAAFLTNSSTYSYIASSFSDVKLKQYFKYFCAICLYHLSLFSY